MVMTTTTTESIVKARRGSDLRCVVTRTPATLNEAAAKRPRWYLEVGPDKILSAEVVGVSVDFADFPREVPSFSYYLEITTATGKGIISLGYSPDNSCVDGGSDLEAFIPAGRGAAMVWGVYVCKKYGQWRGSCMAYLIAHGRGVKTCCGAEIYAKLAGKVFGQRAAKTEWATAEG
jgi:hypothetical protein